MNKTLNLMTMNEVKWGGSDNYHASNSVIAYEKKIGINDTLRLIIPRKHIYKILGDKVGSAVDTIRLRDHDELLSSTKNAMSVVADGKIHLFGFSVFRTRCNVGFAYFGVMTHTSREEGLNDNGSVTINIVKRNDDEQSSDKVLENFSVICHAIAKDKALNVADTKYSVVKTETFQYKEE